MLQHVMVKNTKPAAGFVDSYKNLTVWKRSMDLAEHIYNITSIFPSDGISSLGLHIRDSAADVPSQIAQGYSQLISENRVYYIDEAKKALARMETQLLLAARAGYIGHLQSDSTFELTVEVAELLEELQRSLPVSE